MAIEFTEYDTISDLLLYLNDSLTLNFVVRLSRKNKSGERVFFQYETKSGTDKYGSPVRSIKRSMNFFFVIQNRNVFGNSFIIKPQDVEMIKMLIQTKVLNWFIGDNQAFRISKVVGEDEEQLLLNTVEPVTYFQSDGKYMSFEPVIVYTEDKAGRGIRVSFYTGDYADMPVDIFMGFYNILQSDMYSAACSMVVYAKVPPYEINVYNNTGLGAIPSNKIQDQPMFRHNSFLDNAKTKE